MAEYPLLALGINGSVNLSTALQTIAAGSVVSVNNTLPEGRGRAVGCDLITPQEPGGTAGTLEQVKVSLAIGGVNIKENHYLSTYNYLAWPHSYEYTRINAGSGQNISLSVDNSLGSAATGLSGIFFFENKWANQDTIFKRFNPVMDSVKELDLFTVIGPGLKSAKKDFTIPKGRGNVCGIQFFVDANKKVPDVFKLLCSWSVDGVTIWQDMSGAFMLPNTARPQLIFPICIPGGSTITVIMDTSGVTAGTNSLFGCRLYFDGQKE